MIELSDRKYCCCFTGHRPEKLDVAPEIIVQRLDEAITATMGRGHSRPGT